MSVSILGDREQGQDVRTANGTNHFFLNIHQPVFLFFSIVMAVQAVANIVKSSLGPQGLDKMLVDDIGDVTITNDGKQSNLIILLISKHNFLNYLGATILKQLEVEHPAARVIVQLSQLQDSEVGDGTTSVVIIASELLKANFKNSKLH